MRSQAFDNPRDAEFRVFSQWGEDGIIQYLVSRVPIERDTFVEIGVENYRESNTRFLLVNDNWRGVIIDAGRAHIDLLEWTSMRWRYAIEPLSLFVTRENVNAALRDVGVVGDIGLLSMDIDGNDYWVLEALDAVSPRILVVEYNSLFGAAEPVSTPYDPAFSQPRAHWSRLYFGASLPALHHVATRKGYSLVAGNSHGCNAFFVRNDVLGGLRPLTPAEAWVESRFRSSRGPGGELTYVDSHRDRVALIARLPLVNVATGEITTVGDAFRSHADTLDR